MIAFRLRFAALRHTYGRGRRRLRIARGLVGVAGLLAFDAALRLVGRHVLEGPWTWVLMTLAFAWPWAVARRREASGPGDARDAAALDRRFKLAELLTSAVDVDRRGQRTAVEGQLLAQAAQAASYLDNPQRLEGGALYRESQAMAGCLLLALGLHLLGLVLPLDLPDRLPDLVTLGTGTDAEGGEGPDGGAGLAAGSAGAGSAAGLAEALGDHGAAREIGQALGRGRPRDAAAAARRLADQAGRMSPSGRAELAEAMRSAAAGLPEGHAELKQALDAAAAALLAGGIERETRLGELAFLLEDLSENRAAATVMPMQAIRSMPEGRNQGIAVRGAVAGSVGASVADGSSDGSPATTGQPAAAAQPLLLPEATVLPLASRVEWSEREWYIQAYDGLEEVAP